MSDRCELSDLPADQCACRIHKPAAFAPDVTDLVADGPAFTARYPGRCRADCGDTVEPGDDVVHLHGGGYAHLGCMR